MKKIDVRHIAKLANIPLSVDEEKRFEKQLEETLTYINQLNEIDTKDLEVTSQVTGLENVLDEDEIAPSLSQEDALSNAVPTHNGLFKVSAILNQSS